MFTLYLILSHLFGDFLLQTSWVYKLKIRSQKGIFLHALICALMIPLVLFPYVQSVTLWIVTLLTGVTHFVFDTTKVAYEKKRTVFSLSPFVIDQIGHLSVALLCGLYLASENPAAWPAFDGWIGATYLNGGFALVIAAAILVSYVADIVRYQVMRTKNPHAEYKRDYEGMLKRTFAFALFTFLVVVYFVASAQGFEPGMVGLFLNF